MKNASLAVLGLVFATATSCSNSPPSSTPTPGSGGASGGSAGQAATACGNGVVDSGETCDPPGSCPAICDDGNACTENKLTGKAETCTAACSYNAILICSSGDGCCPAGCSPSTDADCSASCGNGTVDSGETCDPPGSCPASCDDAKACTADQLTGSATNCNVACSNSPILVCTSGDGCCPSGCTATDSDCAGGMGGAGGMSGSAGMGAGGSSGMGGGNGGAGGDAPTCEESTVPTSPNLLGVNVTAAEQLVHKEIFGLLMEILGNDINNGIYVGRSSDIPNTNGIRNDIIEGFKEAGVGAIEWPGGCAANNYNWEANKNPSNTMGVDLFMQFATTVGAEPVLVGRPRPEFAASNRAWIEYVNNNPEHPEWKVKYFKIGNEVWGCGGNLGHDTAAEMTYETWFNANYDVLNTPVNGKELALVGATAGVWTIDPDNTSDWMNVMLGNIGDKMAGIELHDYIYYPDEVPSVGFTDNQYYNIVWLADEGQMAPRIDDVRIILDRHDPEGRIKIIEDEWGDWLMNWKSSDDWLQQNTVMDAISAARTLQVFMKNADRVQMAGLAQAVNVIQSLFLTNSSSGGTDLVKTPTFYVFKMFVPHHTNNAKLAPSTITSEKITGDGQTFNVVSSASTTNDAGQVNISLVNVDLVNTREVTITLESATAKYAMASAQVITGTAKDSFNDFGQPETVNIQTLPATSYQLCGKKLKVTLPSKSVVTLRLDPR
jgi:alpha-N-arabinofuranosidase